jgi:hypothetical protein
MSVPAPHSSWVSIIVRFEHFESVPVWILGTRTEVSNSNPPKQLATQHWFLHYLYTTYKCRCWFTKGTWEDPSHFWGVSIKTFHHTFKFKWCRQWQSVTRTCRHTKPIYTQRTKEKIISGTSLTSHHTNKHFTLYTFPFFPLHSFSICTKPFIPSCHWFTAIGKQRCDKRWGKVMTWHNCEKH